MPPMMDQPPVDEPMGGDQQPDETMPPMDDMGDDIGNNGEQENEGGPGGDVRKYAGELSQALNDYNQEFQNDDEKLNKYAINMIAAQVKDKLDDKDRRAVIKKLDGNSNDGGDSEEDMGLSESYENDNDIVNEIMDELINGRKPTKRDNKKLRGDISKRNPFVSNR